MEDPIEKEKKGRGKQAIHNWLEFLRKGYTALTTAD